MDDENVEWFEEATELTEDQILKLKLTQRKLKNYYTNNE
jgi:hypothetical protein